MRGNNLKKKGFVLDQGGQRAKQEYLIAFNGFVDIMRFFFPANKSSSGGRSFNITFLGSKESA